MIPNFQTDTFAAIAGEFASSAVTSSCDALGMITADYPASLISIPSGVTLPNINSFQKEFLKTILTQNGRTQFFQNPFTDDLSNVRDRLNNIIAAGGTDIGNTDPTAISPSVVASATDLLETLTFFESHTDRLSGKVEPSADEAKFPTLERALAVGASLNHLHQQLDETPTNNPHLAMFGSFFTGKSHIDNLKTILAQPDSHITPDQLAGISSGLNSVQENDVKNFTVGLKKLKRAGMANLILGVHGKQVEGAIIDKVATPALKDLFSSFDTTSAKPATSTTTTTTTSTTTTTTTKPPPPVTITPKPIRDPHDASYRYTDTNMDWLIGGDVYYAYVGVGGVSRTFTFTAESGKYHSVIVSPAQSGGAICSVTLTDSTGKILNYPALISSMGGPIAIVYCPSDVSQGTVFVVFNNVRDFGGTIDIQFQKY